MKRQDHRGKEETDNEPSLQAFGQYILTWSFMEILHKEMAQVEGGKTDGVNLTHCLEVK